MLFVVFWISCPQGFLSTKFESKHKELLRNKRCRNFSNISPHFTYEQGIVSVLLPLHGEPPLLVPSHVLVRVFVPSPHAAEQADHGVQLDHDPSTNVAKDQYMIFIL